MMWPNWRIRESTGQTPFRNIFVYFSARESAMNLPCIGRSFNKFPIFFQTRRVWKPNTYNEIEHFHVTLLPPCWRAKTIHFLSWEIRSIFMQNCFIVSALQHSTEYPIFLTLASPLITSCPIVRLHAHAFLIPRTEENGETFVQCLFCIVSILVSHIWVSRAPVLQFIICIDFSSRPFCWLGWTSVLDEAPTFWWVISWFKACKCRKRSSLVTCTLLFT